MHCSGCTCAASGVDGLHSIRLTQLTTSMYRVPCPQWEQAEPLPARLKGASNISYHPEFSAQYAKAYAYLAPTYVLDEAVRIFQPKDSPVAAAKEVSVPLEGKDLEVSTEREDEDQYSESDSEVDLTAEARYAMHRSRK